MGWDLPRFRGRDLLGLTVACLLFCNTVPSYGAQPPSESEFVRLDVALVRQRSRRCAAAAVAMVVHYWRGLGDREDHVVISSTERCVEDHYSEESRGVYGEDMVKCFRQNGYEPFTFEGEWDDLEKQLIQGRPIIVCLAKSGQKVCHYVVVTGIDIDEEQVWVLDPAKRKPRWLSRDKFARRWRVTRNWTMLVVPSLVCPSNGTNKDVNERCRR